MIRIKNIAIMGMGYVGLTLSVILAKKGFKTYGVEINKDVVNKLKRGEPHFQEKGLKALLKHQQMIGNLVIQEKLKDEDIDAYIISVGTPLLKGEKKPNTEYIKNVLKDVGKHMKKGALVALRSTVPVGLSREQAIPAIEEASGLKIGKDFSFIFAPERTAEGKALIELESNPQIIGGYDENSVNLGMTIFEKITPTVIVVSSIEGAEMLKIIDNTSRDIRFAYCNEIAMICEKLNLDAYELIKAANIHYPRNDIAIPSPGVGGACLSKDPHILVSFAEKKGYAPELIKEGRKINEKIPGAIVARLKNKLKDMGKDIESAKIFIVGFAFKGQPETSDLRDSTTIWFLDELKKVISMKNIFGFDPVISEEELKGLGINTCKSIEEGCVDADVILFMNNHQSYLNIDPFDICEKMNKEAIFYDAWRMFEKSLFEDLKEVHYMGVGL